MADLVAILVWEAMGAPGLRVQPCPGLPKATAHWDTQSGYWDPGRAGKALEVGGHDGVAFGPELAAGSGPS